MQGGAGIGHKRSHHHGMGHGLHRLGHGIAQQEAQHGARQVEGQGHGPSPLKRVHYRCTKRDGRHCTPRQPVGLQERTCRLGFGNLFVFCLDQCTNGHCHLSSEEEGGDHAPSQDDHNLNELVTWDAVQAQWECDKGCNVEQREPLGDPGQAGAKPLQQFVGSFLPHSYQQDHNPEHSNQWSGEGDALRQKYGLDCIIQAIQHTCARPKLQVLTHCTACRCWHTLAG
mmetsp:Transcript_11139/g.19468  ORF Transcript_11139/g.19468 Transcript_11139/m.19468 type:complete len:227 (-) Transcript_11139:323-1003(-)